MSLCLCLSHPQRGLTPFVVNMKIYIHRVEYLFNNTFSAINAEDNSPWRARDPGGEFGAVTSVGISLLRASLLKTDLGFTR